MKLIINIPEEIYEASQIIKVKNEDVIQIPLEVIANGIPLPDNVTNGDVIGEPSRRKGHWIETEYHRWRCSICREKGMSEWDNIHNVRTNFCPNCGAKMGSEDKE